MLLLVVVVVVVDVVIFDVALVFWWVFFGVDGCKLGCFSEQRSDGGLSVRFVCEVGGACVAKQLGKANNNALRRPLHITYSGIIYTPWTDVHHQHCDEIVIG